MKNQNELKEITPDIQPVLKHLPSIEDIKVPEESFDLEELRATQLADTSFDREIEELAPEEQKEYFKNQHSQADTLDNLLDEAKLFEIQKIAVNLKKSWHNFVNKKKRLMEFRHKLSLVLGEKDTCIETLQKESAEGQRLQEEIQGMRFSLQGFLEEKRSIEAQQEEQRKNLTEKEKAYLQQRLDLEKEISKLQAQLK